MQQSFELIEFIQTLAQMPCIVCALIINLIIQIV